MKKAPAKLRIIRKDITDKQWTLYRNLGRCLEGMHQLPDAASTLENRPRPCPISQLPLLF
ncbi:MAG TPA: hypothetical protein VGR89_03430 [Puia sp.]|nr:hypothetical protein [Puia sp.]